MRTFYGVSGNHEILVIILPYQDAIFDILNILPLMLCLRNKNYPPKTFVILHLNQTTIWLNVRVVYKQCLPQFFINFL